MLQHAGGQGGVAEHEAIAVAGEAEGHIEQLGVVQRLAHACTHGVLVVFGFDHRQGNVGLVEQGVVGAQHRALVAVGFVATHHHASSPQGVFTKDLVQAVPSSLLHRGADELVADVAFGKLGLVHSVVRTAPERARPVVNCYLMVLPPLSGFQDLHPSCCGTPSPISHMGAAQAMWALSPWKPEKSTDMRLAGRF